MLKEKFQAMSKDALRKKDTTTRRIMGSILSRFLETEKAGGFKGWTPQMEEDVLRAHIKALKKSVDLMPGTDLAAQYQGEIDLLGEYLPKMADEAETRAIAEPFAAKANGKIGPFMGMVLKNNKGKVDPAIVRKVGLELGLS